MDILDETRSIVDGDRAVDYGDMRECFEMIANLWEAYLNRPDSGFCLKLDYLDVAHMMMLLKIARGREKFKKDSIMDIIGYAYCADKINTSNIKIDEAEKKYYDGFRYCGE